MITTTNTKDAFEQLINYKADMAIYGGGMSERPKEIEWEELYEDELWFVVSPNNRYAHQSITLVEMFQEPFIMREVGSSMREHLFSLCQTYQVKPPKSPCNLMALMKRFALLWQAMVQILFLLLQLEST